MTPFWTFGDKSTIAVILPLVEQAAKKKKKKVSQSLSKQRRPPVGHVLTDILRKTEGTRLGNGSVDL